MARFSQTLAFLMVIAAGLVGVLVHWSSPAAWSRLTSQTWDGVLDNRLAHAVDDTVVASVPKTPELDGIANGLRYRLLGDAGQQVRVGCPGWLFLTEELVEQQDGEANLQARARIAVTIAANLKHRGITPMILLIPDKAELAAAEGCGIARSTQSVARKAAWHKAIAPLSIPEIDLGEAWPKPGVWRTDTHWDRTGARFAADLVAKAIDPILGDAGREQITLQADAGPHARIGDLMRLAALDRSPSWLGPLPDQELNETATAAHSGGLLDDTPPALVILTGTSYSLNSGFFDYLEHSLQREVVQRSEYGGGFSGAILDTLQKQPELLDQAKIVLWEFPERALTLPLTESEQAYLRAHQHD